MKSAVFGSLMLPVGLGLALLAAAMFRRRAGLVAAYGTSNGLKAVQRATLPLALFGRAQFGAYMGRLALPQGIVAAVAPPIMAAVLSRFGTAGALWLSFGRDGSLAAMVLLARQPRSSLKRARKQKIPEYIRTRCKRYGTRPMVSGTQVSGFFHRRVENQFLGPQT